MVFRRFGIYRSFIRSLRCFVGSFIRSFRNIVVFRFLRIFIRFFGVVRFFGIVIRLFGVVRFFSVAGVFIGIVVRYIDIGYLDIIIGIIVSTVRQTDIVFLVADKTLVTGLVRIA